MAQILGNELIQFNAGHIFYFNTLLTSRASGCHVFVTVANPTGTLEKGSLKIRFR